MNKNLNSFCPLPFGSLSINSDGTVRVCCHTKIDPADANGVTFNFNRNSELDPLTALNSDLHREIRRDMMSSRRHRACYNCWAIEDSGGFSYREAARQDHSSNLIQALLENTNADGSIKSVIANYVELSLGNICNLKCRSCNPGNSILWVSEYIKLYPESKDSIEEVKGYNWFTKHKFKENLNPLLRQTKKINFLGGEPLIIDEHLQILKYVVAQGCAQDIELQYNSNLTVLKSEVLALWPKFKKVNLCISIEAHGILNEYLRHPMQWKKFEQNLAALAMLKKTTDINLQFATTFQALNVMHLPELFSYHYTWNGVFGTFPLITWVDTPAYLDVRVLPRHYRESVYAKNINYLDRLENRISSPWIKTTKGYFEQMMSDWDEEKRLRLWKQLATNTRLLDQSRKEDLRKVAPDLGELVYNDQNWDQSK